MAIFIGLEAVGWDSMTSSTWGLILAGISCTGVVLGLAYVLYSLIKRVSKWFASVSTRFMRAITYQRLIHSSLVPNSERGHAQQPSHPLSIVTLTFSNRPTRTNPQNESSFPLSNPLAFISALSKPSRLPNNLVC